MISLATASLLATLLLMQPRMLLAFAARAHWLMLSIRTTRSFSAKLDPRGLRAVWCSCKTTFIIFRSLWRSGDALNDGCKISVSPVFRKGKDNPRNYMPVSLTSFPGKTLEHIPVGAVSCLWRTRWLRTLVFVLLRVNHFGKPDCLRILGTGITQHEEDIFGGWQ